MQWKTWPVAALALGGLLVLVAVSVFESARRAGQIYDQVGAINDHYRQADGRLRRLRSDVHLSGIYIRDYLLDVDAEAAAKSRERLSQARASQLQALGQLRAMLGPAAEPRLLRLEANLLDYWQAFDPLFSWTADEKERRRTEFLRLEVLPRREAVLGIAREIEELNNAHLATESAALQARHDGFRGDLYRLLWRAMLLGIVVAVAAVVRLRILEGRSEAQRERTEAAEQAMRALSQQLVATQEEERKKISRELHDQVGQMLTALRMELGRIDREGDGRVSAAVTEARQLVDTMVGTVRDLALGLRPSMLDDFGLQPALEWLARDVERRSGVHVHLSIDGTFDDLSDRYRTCAYRAVQEALTNCVRHAHATRIGVSLQRSSDRVTVRIGDDGIGLEPGRSGGGLGLVGLSERVGELGGRLSIASPGGRGTEVSITLPLVMLEAATAHPPR